VGDQIHGPLGFMVYIGWFSFGTPEKAHLCSPKFLWLQVAIRML